MSEGKLRNVDEAISLVTDLNDRTKFTIMPMRGHFNVAGANMVVCLSSMLHSIGVGNMLPSWVRMVCVDINPAVVTKLSDRGSQQTIGVVTDVGGFLSLLAQKLAAQ
jgi:hypothetical protein